RIVIWRQGPVRLRFSLHQDANLPVRKWTSTGGRTEAAQGGSLQRANFVPIAGAPLPRTSEVSIEPTSISTLHDCEPSPSMLEATNRVLYQSAECLRFVKTFFSAFLEI